MMSEVLGPHRAAVAKIASAEIGGVGIEDLAIEAWGGGADAILRTDDRRKVACADDAAPALPRGTHKHDDVVVHIVGVDEMEAGWIGVVLPERRLLAIDAVQLAHQRLQSAMVVGLEQVPAEAPGRVPPSPPTAIFPPKN